MDAERLARYADKFEHIEERLEQFTRWSKRARGDEMSRAASFKAFQEVGDAMADVCAMLTRDLGLVPKDDYSNVAKLADEGVLSDESQAAIEELTGLRNRLVHEYDTFDDEIALSSAIELVPATRQATKELKGWISKNG